jgi:hypothetical protein
MRLLRIWIVLTGCLALGGAAGCTGATTAPSHPGATLTGTLEASSSTAADWWNVAVAGTNLKTTVDEAGKFELRGIPAGVIQLLFSNGAITAGLPLSGISPGAVIHIDVIIEGDTATLRSGNNAPGADVPAHEKIALCHRTGSGTYHLLEVDRSAEPAHRAHGDAAVGERIPDNRTKVFDSACRPRPFGVTVETSTNGERADDPPGPTIPVGSAIIWRYVVVNLSAGALTNVSVTDNRGVGVDCGGETTVPFAGAMTCTAAGVAIAGQYENIGRVTALSVDGPVEDDDPSHYFGIVAGGAPPEEGQKRIQLCHRTGGPAYHLLEVAKTAEPAHRAHGDAKPGEPVPGRPGKTFSASCALQ